MRFRRAYIAFCIGGSLAAAPRLRASPQCQPCSVGWSTRTFESAAPDSTVRAMAVFDDGAGPALFVGGAFTTVNGIPSPGIARWNGRHWSTLGTGIDGTVRALTVFDDGAGPALYAAGIFQSAGGMPASNIARWDGLLWQPLDAGLDQFAYALAVYDDGGGPALFVGGQFNTAGRQPARGLARWRGGQWSAVGGGVAGTVRSLCVCNLGSGVHLYAGGVFFEVGNHLPAPFVARWDGAAWSAIGTTSLNGPVFAMMRWHVGPSAVLAAGGAFDHLGTAPLNHIAVFNGTSWQSLQNGVNADVYSLTTMQDAFSDTLYAGGTFSAASGIPAWGIAQYNGSIWSSLGGGANSWVAAMAVFTTKDGPALYAGGNFTAMDGAPASFLADWRCPTVRGDMNHDGEVNALDVPSFVALLLGTAEVANESCLAADVTLDGIADSADIQTFVRLCTMQ